MTLNKPYGMCESCFRTYEELVNHPTKYDVVVENDKIRVIRFDLLQLDNNFFRNLQGNFDERVEHFRRCLEKDSGNIKIIGTDSSIAYLFLGYDNENPQIMEELKIKHRQKYSSHIYIR